MENLFFQCKSLVKTYSDNLVVNNVTFSIAPGECLGVIGPNGAGKTTTLRMCLGLTSPDSGSVTGFGHRMPQDALYIKSRIGVVSQFDTLDPDFTSCSTNAGQLLLTISSDSKTLSFQWMPRSLISA